MVDNTGHRSGAASDLKTRIISAAVLAPVALGATWMGGWFFAALLAAAALVMAQELARLLYRATVGARDAAGLVVAGLSAIVLAPGGLPGAALAPPPARCWPLPWPPEAGAAGR